MKAKNSALAILLLSALFLFSTSCSDKDNEKPGAKGTDNQSINDWIHDQMSIYYFWNNQMTPVADLNFNDAPDKFFYKTLYRHKELDGDRFSNLEKDGVTYHVKSEYAIGKASHNDIGFEFQAFANNPENPSSLAELCVTYIKKGSKAEEQNKLKRGDWITKIDDKQLTVGNALGLVYSGKSSLKLTLDNGNTYVLETAGAYYENPVHTDRIIQVGDKKIGYILYNFFANGREENSMEYAIEMNNVLSKFNNEGIHALVLDLRYNGGGYVESGTYIASAIVPERGTTNKIYTRRKYNSTLEKNPSYARNKDNPFVDMIRGTSQPIPKLELKSLYVLTSRNTASASEQIINGLKVLLDKLTVIGETTIGKNMESFAIEDTKNKENKWILHPLTSMSFNSKDFEKYHHGFTPHIGMTNWEGRHIMEVDEFESYRKEGVLYPHGDVNETLLAIAIKDFTGISAKRAISSLRTKQGRTIMTPAYSSIERKGNAMIVDFKE